MGLTETIFRLAQERASEDGHVWLQHGLFEMRRDGGDLNRAAKLFARAQSKLPKSELVSHSYAELELVRATRESNPLVQEKHLKEAHRLASDLLGKNARGSYGHHTIFKIEHMRLQRALEEVDSPMQGEDVAKAIKNAEHILSKGLQQYPGDVTLVSSEANLARTLRDSDRARMALQRAVDLDPRNASIVGSLGRLLLGEGKTNEAKTLLTQGVNASPGDRNLNFGLAMLLLETEADGAAIEFHFRRAFMEGDRNLDAQFMYARQLYINGKTSEAQARFAKLKGQNTAMRTLNNPRRPWIENAEPKRFRGRIDRIARQYGLIKRDGDGDKISVQVHSGEPNPFADRTIGDRVAFSISFNFHGPVATDIGSEW